MINFQKLSEEAFKTAIEKGWHEVKDGKVIQRCVPELCSLFHSEISEAVEELRAPKPETRAGIYFRVKGEHGDSYLLADDPAAFTLEAPATHKPEGVAVELADLLIRLGDACGTWDVADLVMPPCDEKIRTTPFRPDPKNTLVGQLADLHHSVSRLFARVQLRWNMGYTLRDVMVANDVSDIVTWVERFCLTNELNLERALTLKLAYNKTRPWRHGNKLA